MRKIKFRGLHTHAMLRNKHLSNTWVYGYLCSGNYIYSPELKGEMLVDSKTVGQYTGLNDKNGKEIYEGDIIQYDFMKAKIIYGYCGFELEWLTPRVATIRNRKNEPIFSNISLMFEVIGNIYENLELLD